MVTISCNHSLILSDLPSEIFSVGSFNLQNFWKVFKCCSMNLHIYSNSLYTKAITCSLIVIKHFPACFYWSNSFILSKRSLRSEDNLPVSVIPEGINPFGFENSLSNKDPAMIAGELSNLARVSFLVPFLPTSLRLKFRSFPKSYISFRSYGLERSTL